MYSGLECQLALQTSTLCSIRSPWCSWHLTCLVSVVCQLLSAIVSKCNREIICHKYFLVKQRIAADHAQRCIIMGGYCLNAFCGSVAMVCMWIHACSSVIHHLYLVIK